MIVTILKSAVEKSRGEDDVKTASRQLILGFPAKISSRLVMGIPKRLITGILTED